MVRKLCFAALALLATSLGCTVEMDTTAQAPQGSNAPTPPGGDTASTNTNTVAPVPEMPAPSTGDAAAGDASSISTVSPALSGDGTMPTPQGSETAPSMPSGQPDYSVPGSETSPSTPSGDGTMPAPMPDPMPTPDYAVPGSETAPSTPNYGAPGIGQAAAAPPEKPFEEMTLLERSESCFKKGEETDGFRWLQAHAIAADLEQAGDTLEKLRWTPGPKKPSLGTRFGVAVKFDVPIMMLGQIGSIPAIGDAVPGLIREGEGQTPPPAAAARPTTMPTNPAESLRFFAGDFGVKFLQQLETRRSEGAWGEVVKELDGSGSMLAKAANDPYGASSFGPSSGTDNAKFGFKPKGEGFELLLSGGEQISPGLIWLGLDTSGMSAARKAVDKGVDCVLFIDVKILVGRNAPPRNETKVIAMDVATGKPLFSTEKLDSFKVYETRVKRPNAKDPVEAALDPLFEAIDEAYAVKPMPEMTPEVALNRARTLIADLPRDPLPALAEMRYYRHAGLLDDAQYAIACKSLAPQEGAGEALASQDESERIAAVEGLLDATKGEDESSDGEKDEEKKDADAPASEDAAPAISP